MLVVAGEALIDLVPDADGRRRTLPGGSSFNVAVGLGTLDADAALFAALSNDAFGTLLAHELAAIGVRCFPRTRTEEPTTLAVVHLDADGDATYAFYLDGTSALRLDDPGLVLPDGEAAAEQPELDTAPLHVSLGAVRLTTPGTGRTLARLLDAATARPFVSLDPNVRLAVIGDPARERDALLRAVATVDLVKVSDEDLAALFPDRDPIALAGEWARSGPALVIVTRGARGATAVRADGGMLTVASLPVSIVDTVGAGDAFTAGLLAALDERGLLDRSRLRAADAGTLREVLAFASTVAAVTCTRSGARPPTRHDVATFTP